MGIQRGRALSPRPHTNEVDCLPVLLMNRVVVGIAGADMCSRYRRIPRTYTQGSFDGNSRTTESDAYRRNLTMSRNKSNYGQSLYSNGERSSVAYAIIAQ